MCKRGFMKRELGVFKALSDATRLRLMRLLVSSGTPLCICEIMDALSLKQYNASKHARELKKAGLIEEKRAGKYVFYNLTADRSDFLKKAVNSIMAINREYFKKDEAMLIKK
jgi:ArsR family transcriptional regulator